MPSSGPCTPKVLNNVPPGEPDEPLKKEHLQGSNSTVLPQSPSHCALSSRIQNPPPTPSPSRGSLNPCARFWLDSMQTLSSFNFKNMMEPAMLKCMCEWWWSAVSFQFNRSCLLQ